MARLAHSESSTPKVDSPVEIGAMIAGKYRVERVIGQGGMGVVVAAMHDELDQRVAIKFLSPENAKGSEWISRFSREARAAAKIKNEHAVKVFDVGKLENGIPYMVMEFLDGKNLDEILEHERTISIEDSADYMLQACEALAEAHLVGIVHRDLKPANLFLTHRSDGTTCVKILDFGISKLDTTIKPDGGFITHTTSLVGSPLYMSPERLRGAKDVDRRSDIWSLGVMLQEMLTGYPSFMADTIPEIHAAVLQNTPTPLKIGCPKAPPELEALIAKCLQKSPEDRFQNVQQFADALGAIAPGSQGSVERIARIVGGSGKRDRLSSIPSGASGPVTPLSISNPDPKLAITASEREVPTVSARTLGDTLKKSSGKLAAACAAVVLLLVVVVFIAGRNKGTATHASGVTPPPASSQVAVTQAHVDETKPETATTTASNDPADVEETTVIDPKTRSTVRVTHIRMREAGVAASASVSISATASAAPSVVPTAQSSSPEVIDYGGRN